MDNKFEKINEFRLDGEQKLYEDFGETTPLSMLQDKFYVYTISINIKYAIQSPQPCKTGLSFINKLIKNLKNIFDDYGFDLLKK